MLGLCVAGCKGTIALRNIDIRYFSPELNPLLLPVLLLPLPLPPPGTAGTPPVLWDELTCC